MSRATFPPERVGRYRLLRPIGSGGMGEVYLAQFESAVGVRRLAAVKLVRNALSSPQTQRGLLAEARLAALITHPNIVQVFDADLEDGLPWFAVEFVPGLSLAELMALVDGPLPPWTAARIVADLAGAAHAVHEAVDQQGKALDVVHRDITPHNVLLSWEGVVKLSDFGVARSSLQSSFTRDGVIKGKLGYMSPEQAGGGAVDRRSDIFSLGVVLWELVAGRPLFLGGTNAEVLASTLRCEIPRLTQVHSSLPESLSEIAEAALQREPAARFATAQELERALLVALARSSFVVGAAELAQYLASVAPERVREHERWLKEPPLLAAAPRTESPARKERPWARTAALWLALGVVTLAIVGLRFASNRRAPSAAAAPALTLASEPASAAAVPGVLAAHASAAPATVTSAGSPDASSGGPLPAPAPRAAAPARSVAAALPITTGTVNISAHPSWAEILVDGKPSGSTPISCELSTGLHVLDARPLGKTPGKRQQVRVLQGKTTRVEFTFD